MFAYNLYTELKVDTFVPTFFLYTWPWKLFMNENICSITYYFNYFPCIASFLLAVLHIWDKKTLTDIFFSFSLRRGLRIALN